jgi:rSAM/selenodomain-associated transferase 1
MNVGILVLAKKPRPGHCKTRLSPPCTPVEAARLAGAALHDTLAAVARSDAEHKVVVIDGELGDQTPSGFDVLRQRGNGLAERLRNAFDDFGGTAVLIGMDTPQVTPALLNSGCATLESPSRDAVLGPAHDGGYWAIGFTRPLPDAFAGVPMSTPKTFASQLDRLQSMGLSCALLPKLRDVDVFDDACDVASSIPTSEFAYTLGRVLGRIHERIA